MKKLIVTLSLSWCVMSFLLMGCGSNSHNRMTNAASGTIAFQLSWNQGPRSPQVSKAIALAPAADVCADYGVTTINASVSNTSGQTVATGSWPCAAHAGTISNVPAGAVNVTIDLSGQFVYVTNKGSNSVSQFNIGTMGRLTPNSPTTAIAQKSPYSLAISHGTIPIAAVAKYAYVTNRGTSRTISQYTIGANGALTSMNPATVAAGEFPTGVAIKGGYQ